MYGELLKTMKRYVRNSVFGAGIGDENTTFLHKAIIALTCCNISIFNVYAHVLQDDFI